MLPGGADTHRIMAQARVFRNSGKPYIFFWRTTLYRKRLAVGTRLSFYNQFHEAVIIIQ